MTFKERALAVLREHLADGEEWGTGITDGDLERVAGLFALAIRKAVAEEREACARRLDAAARRFPDNPLVASVLMSEADSLRGRIIP